jgi:hypothetical protein
MGTAANITSIEAVSDLKVALLEFEAGVRDAVTQLLLELQHAVAWVEQDRARFWPEEVRRSSDQMVQARQELERCEMALRAEDKRSCYEQKLALEKAKRRLRTAEEKARLVRHWRVTVNQEADLLHGRLSKLLDFLDTDFPRAVASLQRIIAALDKYTDRTVPVPAANDGPSVAASGEGGP